MRTCLTTTTAGWAGERDPLEQSQRLLTTFTYLVVRMRRAESTSDVGRVDRRVQKAQCVYHSRGLRIINDQTIGDITSQFLDDSDRFFVITSHSDALIDLQIW